MTEGNGIEAVVLSPCESLALRLFAFPHAGGTHQSFSEWPTGLPDDVELVSYSLPDRSRGRTGTPYAERSQLVGDLVNVVAKYDDGTPYVFFGHSFGALVAFEVCRQLVSEGRRPPELLMLSAHRAPDLVPRRLTHSLNDAEFLDAVREWGLIPEELLNDPEVLGLVLPPLYSDLALDEQYPYERESGSEQLDVSCVVYGGSEDRTVTEQELLAWRRHFSETVAFHVEFFAGGHFFTISAREDLLVSIRAQLDFVRQAVGPSIVTTAPSLPPSDESLWSRFSRRFFATPDAPALADGDRRWSYRALHQDALSLGYELTKRGVGQGDVVGLLLPHSADFLISLLTCFGLNAPACLLEKHWPAQLLGEFLVNANVRIVVTTTELARRLPPAFRDQRRLLLLDRDWAKTPHESLSFTFPEADLSAVALISMTSGSSGVPKAVLNTHRSCLYCFDARNTLYPYADSSRDGLNVFFAWECLRPLLTGKPVSVIPDDCIIDPVRLVAELERAHITRIVVTPSLLASVLDHPTIGPVLAERLGHMEIIFLMGEVVPAGLVEKAATLLPPHLKLVNAYSTWESLDVSYAELLPEQPADAKRSHFAPAGKILDGTSAILLDEKGQCVPYGGVGELYVAGPGVAVGYLNDTEMSAERFVGCPSELAEFLPPETRCYRTGDRARFHTGNVLEILGRTGDVIKVRGFKVSLRSVERIFADVGGITRVLIRALPDRHTGQLSLIAYVVCDAGEPSDTALARARVTAKHKLPEYARPRHYVALNQLPISRSGSRKVDLGALPLPLDQRATTTAISTNTPMEQRLIEAWSKVLGIAVVDPADNFFELGGDSLSAAKLAGLLTERYGMSLPVIDVFSHPRLRDLAAHVTTDRNEGTETARQTRERPKHRSSPASKVAIVGMSGRFPGAPDIYSFWRNLRAGVDSLSHFSRERLLRKGVSPDLIGDPKWVPAGQIIGDADKFDASFWGIGQREAVLMDPQHRVFIEVAWQALEQAGYARRNNPYRHRTGVYAACGIDGYLIHHLDGGGLKNPADPAGLFLTEIGNEKDYVATRVSYLLDLGGPAMTVTSACSSALVAVAQAAQAIIHGQCDMAIAGASSINFPNFGYRYEDGLVGSEDGRVRPFDAAASGTLFGDSVGAVVLKRLDDALADGDHIWAVLSGYGVSNDGRIKAGYTAPSARAQAQCVSDALAMAGIWSGQVSYVECHATATRIGDAIELHGLLDAFSRHRNQSVVDWHRCAIGSVKGNIGHANCAAGITGLIKTVLCMHYRTLVPTVNFHALNLQLVELVDSKESPFTVQQTCEDWTTTDSASQLPRRAGVSSFGIGGTNAHVILEEAPTPLAISDGSQYTSRSLHLVTLSARSESALRRNAEAFAEFLEPLDEQQLAAAVRSLHLYRESHEFRESKVVMSDRPTRSAELRQVRGAPYAARRRAAVAFCFPGQGSQTAGMARALYRGRADGGLFRDYFNDACASMAHHLPLDPAPLILGADDESVMRPLITQCGLFAVEYALAQTLIELGVRPVAVAGHSIGEYAAAVIAGVLTLPEAAQLVATRALATEALSNEPSGECGGGMLGVVGSRDSLINWLAGREDIWLAAENAPGRFVLAGTMDALLTAQPRLESAGFACRRVPVSHPFHSDLVKPIADSLSSAADEFDVRLPRIPMASNLTGSWMGADYRPGSYWSKHVLSTVRWRECIDVLSGWDPDLFVELGPGTVLTSLAKKQLAHQNAMPISAMPFAKSQEGDDEVGLLETIGTLWCHGVPVDFAPLHNRDQTPPRVLLPPYSFDRASYWTDPDASIYVADESGDEHCETPEPMPMSRWLTRYADRPESTVRLYCFAFAGGGSGTFRSWASAAPDWLDVVAVEPPGRDKVDDNTELDELAEAIKSDAGGASVALCGLSFGASLILDLLSGPLAGEFSREQVKAVSIVGRAPILPGVCVAPLDLTAADSYLIVPDELRHDEGWQGNVLPLLEMDLEFDNRSERRIVERQDRDGPRLLDCPLQIQCGTADPSFPTSAAQRWYTITSSPVVEVSVHEGGHDFIVYQQNRIFEVLCSFVERLIGPDIAEYDHSASRLLSVRWAPLAPSTNHSPSGIPWVDLNEVDVSGFKFLREQLTAVDSKAALFCRLLSNTAPEKCCAVFLELLRSAGEANLVGELVLILPATEASGLVVGMTRSFILEGSRLTIRHVYVHEWPAESDARRSLVDRLLRLIEMHPHESDLMYRDGYIFGRRLLRTTAPPLPPATLGSSTGSYLITGGTGGIGQVVIDWLIHNQGVEPSRIWATGRIVPQGDQRGVRYMELDLSHQVAVAELASQVGPLAGIFHVAGVLDDGIVSNLDPSRFTAVLAPKTALAGISDVGTSTGAPWVVAFSSTSGLLGAAGQANYAAANAWMDAYASFNSSGTEPEVVSISWGTWDGTGMAAHNASKPSDSLSASETPLTCGVALSLLGRVVGNLLAGGSESRHYAACDISWASSPFGGAPLVRDLGGIVRPDAIGLSNSNPGTPRSRVMPAGDSDGIRSFLQTYVPRWDESEKLEDLGLDSLDFARMRAELARQFGKQVPLTAIAQPGQSLGALYELLSDL